MPKLMVHPRLKRILSESSSAVSSPPDTSSDTGKPDPESEEQDPEVEEHEEPPPADPESESPGSKMDISDEDVEGLIDNEADNEDVDADAENAGVSSDTQKPVEDMSSGGNTPSRGVHTPQIDTPMRTSRDRSVSPQPGPSTVPSPKELSPAPPSTSVSATNRSPGSRSRPSLKIKLKLGARPNPAVSEPETSEEKPRGRGRGKGKAKRKANSPIQQPLVFTLPSRTLTTASEASRRSSVESEEGEEDADADSENDQDKEPQHGSLEVGNSSSVGSGQDDVGSEGENIQDYLDDGEDSEVMPGGNKGRLTARQAVLASMVGADHVELSTSSRKKQLTSDEIALRREETARKRKNMSEKKLEDEKTETINRLLKKQSSRSRAKRNALLNSSVVPTPQSHSGDEGESESGATEPKGKSVTGPTWRWVSNSTGMRLGVPHEVINTPLIHTETKPKLPPTCDVSGCNERRKYRLVNDFERGACGLEHFRILTGAS